MCERNADWLASPWPSFSVGDGWAAVVRDLFEDVGALMRGSEPEARLTVLDVKEKYGSLRADWMGPVADGTFAAIEALVLAAENRSERTCDVCGAAGRLRTTRPAGGWLAVRCREHEEGFVYPTDEQ